MMSSSQRRSPGTVALVGSGEYLDVMNEVDTYLLNTVGRCRDSESCPSSNSKRSGAKWTDIVEQSRLTTFQEARCTRYTCNTNH